jgi:hypothetical protein
MSSQAWIFGVDQRARRRQRQRRRRIDILQWEVGARNAGSVC